MLAQRFTPNISNFDLAKLCSKDENAFPVTAPKETTNYIASEVFSKNINLILQCWNVDARNDLMKKKCEYCNQENWLRLLSRMDLQSIRVRERPKSSY